MNKQTILKLLAVAVLCANCVSYESLVNYDNAPPLPDLPQKINNYVPIIIQPNDILHIEVSSIDEVAAQPFALNNTNNMAAANNGQGLLINGYLVNQEGYVTFPTIGKVQLGGLEIEAAKEKMLTALAPYFEAPPIVKMRLLNFNISVNGEVSSPGTFQIQNERVTIVEAITQAGDFTDYSDRDSILVMRERAGERTFGYVSFESSDIFSSPFFYLQQNDVVYVRPDRRKVAVVNDPANRIFTWVSAITSTTAFIITITRNN